MRTTRNTTVAAENNIQRARGGVVAVWNDSQTIELTMTVREIKEMEKRFFIDIEEVISDELMRDLLGHFQHEGTLLDEWAMRI